MPSNMHEINRSAIEEFRANGGKVTQNGLQGTRLVLLTTTGAKSGRPCTTPLAAFEDEAGGFFLWASAMGSPTDPAWYRNLSADPQVTVEVGTDSGDIESHAATATTATTATGAERHRLLAVLKDRHPHVAAHQERTDREIPIVVIEA